jgi:hypothetical protein
VIGVLPGGGSLAEPVPGPHTSTPSELLCRLGRAGGSSHNRSSENRPNLIVTIVPALNPNVISVTLAYFPASRASLKDKPYYDEVIRDLVRRDRPAASK